MIRVFSYDEVPIMDIIELQGRVSFTDEARQICQENKGHDFSSTVTPHEDGGDNKEDKRSNDCGARSSVTEVPLGRVEHDQLSEKRCTLCIDTLHITGSYGEFKDPILVLRRCPRSHVDHFIQNYKRLQPSLKADDAGRRVDELGCTIEKDIVPCELSGDGNVGENAEAETMLLEHWLEANPEALSMDNLFYPKTSPVHALSPSASPSASRRGSLVGGSDDGAGPSSKTNSGDMDSLVSPGVKRLRPDDIEEGSDNNKDAATARSDARSKAHEKESLEGVDKAKDYELVGLVQSYVLFDGKPARVFQT